MRTHRRRVPALEAIQYQGHSLLFKELTLAFQTLIDLGPNISAEFDVVGQRITKIIKRHTGLNITLTFYVEDEMFISMYSINPNHPFFRYLNEAAKFDLGPSLNDRLSRLRSEIDLAKGRVSGPLSEIPFSMGVGVSLWMLIGLTAEDIAACMIHEIGHAFTSLERLTHGVMANMAIVSAVEALGKAENRTEKLRIIKATEEMADVKVDAESLADARGTKQFEAVFIRAVLDKLAPSATGARGYELTGSEFSADQFANRHGAGMVLARVMDRMDRFYGSDDYRRGRVGFMAMEVVKVIWFIMNTIYTGGLALLAVGLMLIWGGFEDRVYDTPADRMRRIRHDMVQVLKNRRLSKDHRAKLEADIKAMDVLIGTAKDRRTLLNMIWQSLAPSRRRAFNARVFQQDLEKIINNDLFVAASNLTSLASAK